MKVTLVAHTVLSHTTDEDDLDVSSTGYNLHYWDHELPPSEVPEGCDELAEFAGRACYQSWERPNPETATNAKYLANIIKQAHFSVLEHASATFYVTGVSRALTHELIRHRHLSFSQLSQRFCKPEGDPVLHPAFRELAFPDNEQSETAVKQAAWNAYLTYQDLYESLRAQGFSVKESREAARMVLPNAQETRIVVTGNMRAWREMLQKRLSPSADAEIREMAEQVLGHLKSLAPNTFADMEVAT